MDRKLIWLVVILAVVLVGVFLIVIFKKDSDENEVTDNTLAPKPYPSSIMTDSARKTWNNITLQQQFNNIGNIGAFNCRLIDGTNDYSDHSWGNAIDFTGSPMMLENLRNYLEKNANKLNVKYVIYNREISTAGKNRKPYTGVDPHTLHLHVDFYPSPSGNPPCAERMSSLPYGD